MTLPGWLFILFLGLKLLGVIGWSWWWVFSPLWASAIVTIALIATGVAIPDEPPRGAGRPW